MGTLVNNIHSPRTGHMPTDAELEAEAERERDRSRREAERILIQEAEERRMMEERVMAMFEIPPRGSPTRAQTMPAAMPDPPSPSASQKSGVPSWWIAAKSRLTPTKELTPAQQVIQETKEKEKQEKKMAKQKEKVKAKESFNEWPASSDAKFNDPAFFNLAAPLPPPRRPMSSSPVPSTPPAAERTMSLPPSLAPSPARPQDGQPASPSREQPPFYAQFNSQGTLDVPTTLLTIAKRFEKLEKWTVSHVRALEDRMSDVERWLVDKEEKKAAGGEDEASPDQAISEIRDEMVELQGRIGELGREMAKMATSPSNLSSGPSRSSAPVSSAPPTTSTIVVHGQTTPASIPVTTTSHPRVVSSTAIPVTAPPPVAQSHPRTPSLSRRESDTRSPPFVPAGVTSHSNTPRSRLPYPTGDYATPPDSVLLNQGMFSPTNSPPSSLNTASHNRPVSVSGLPTNSYSLATASGLPRSMSPPAASPSPTPVGSGGSGNGTTISTTTASSNSNSSSNNNRLQQPPQPPRPSSVSPTPRKRYTVALGAPVTKRRESDISDSAGDPFTTSPGPIHPDELSDSQSLSGTYASMSEDEERDDAYDETIGKSASRSLKFSRVQTQNASSNSNGNGIGDSLAVSDTEGTSNQKTSPSNSRIRAQSSYGTIAGYSTLNLSAGIVSSPPSMAAPSPITPLRPRIRSKSTERLNVGLGISGGGIESVPTTPSGRGEGKFVDPLLVRKQERRAKALESLSRKSGVKDLVGKKKVPVGDLVAFFDQDK